MFLDNFLEKKLSSRVERGFFIIDKVAGKTSHDEVFDLRRTLSSSFNKKFKVGHSGTLDPKVTGVLVCGVGQSTRALEYILLSKKVYIAEFLFHKKINRKRFEKSLKNFRGKIKQLPPIKSAVKREERIREIYKLEIINFSDNNRSAIMLCEVERGTYIRKLAHDLGVDLKINISMGELKRIQAGPFSEKNSFLIKSKDLKKHFEIFSKIKNPFKKYFLYKKVNKFIYPLETLFNRLEKEKKIKKIFVNKKSLKYIKAGNPLRIKNIDFSKSYPFYKKDEKVSVFYDNYCLAIGSVVEEFKIQNKKDFEKEVILLNKILYPQKLS